MKPYEDEIRLVNMNHESICIEIPKDVSIYSIDIDSTNFDLGYFFDIEIYSNENPLFVGVLGNNVKSINILNWKYGAKDLKIKMLPNFLLLEKFKKWLITNMDVVITINGYTLEPNIKYSEYEEMDDEFKEDWI